MSSQRGLKDGPSEFESAVIRRQKVVRCFGRTTWTVIATPPRCDGEAQTSAEMRDQATQWSPAPPPPTPLPSPPPPPPPPAQPVEYRKKYDFPQLQPENVAKYVGRGRPLERQTQAVILSVVRCCEEEMLNQGPLTPLDQVQARAAQVCSIGERSLRRVVKRALEGGELETPGKTRARQAAFPKVDAFMVDVIRRIVHRFFAANAHVTLDKLLDTCKVEVAFPYGRATLHVLLVANGFKYKRRGNRLVLTEKPEIRAWRVEFLRTMRAHESQHSQVFYLDETWVNAGYTTPKTWYDTMVEKNPDLALCPNSGLTLGPKDPTGKGERLIVVHIGNEDGFLDGGLLTFQSKSTGDYHEEMDGERFQRYFVEQILPRLPHGAVVVMDNASYHSKLLDPPPNGSARRGVMEQWLTEKGIQFEQTRTKGELYKRFIQPIRGQQRFKKYVIDELAAASGVTIVRLPPYHCQFNPIELIWALLKTRIAKRNTAHTLTCLKAIFAEEVARISAADWQSACRHVRSVLAEFYARHQIAPVVAPVLISAADQSAPADGDESGSDSDDEDDDSAERFIVQPDGDDILPPDLNLEDVLYNAESINCDSDMPFLAAEL